MLCEASGDGKERKGDRRGARKSGGRDDGRRDLNPIPYLFFPLFPILAISIHLSPTTMATAIRVVKLIPSKTVFLLCDIQTKFRAQLVFQRCLRWLSFIRLCHSRVRFDGFHSKQTPQSSQGAVAGCFSRLDVPSWGAHRQNRST